MQLVAPSDGANTTLAVRHIYLFPHSWSNGCSPIQSQTFFTNDRSTFLFLAPQNHYHPIATTQFSKHIWTWNVLSSCAYAHPISYHLPLSVLLPPIRIQA